jgi:ubiquinone/menaquinone biosynthesis C-methylase UbiE
MQNVFNHFYKDYDKWYQTKVGAFVDKVETDAIWVLLEPKQGMKILDVGCGTGNQSLKLAKKGCKVTGIDIAPNMLHEAERKAKENGLQLDFHLMDCLKLDFPDDFFDAAVSVTAFEFVKDLQSAYREIRRVVRSGGTIVIGTIQRGGDWAMLYESDICKGTAYEFANFLSKEELCNLDPNAYDGSIECLFIPPGEPDEKYSEANEQEQSKTGKKGGFVCVRFK